MSGPVQLEEAYHSMYKIAEVLDVDYGPGVMYTVLTADGPILIGIYEATHAVSVFRGETNDRPVSAH